LYCARGRGARGARPPIFPGADGIVGNATWPALTIVTQQGDSGAKVRAVQSQLNESGYGLVVDGIVGDNTWNKMAW
jgi:peptidoglycan hydrolase-like protein with peptidoglycan-binding domain